MRQGIEVEIHGVRTRIIAWPGNGFQTESIHVLTLSPGQEMEMHAYGMAEEAMLCLKGGGEAYVRGQWVAFDPGDFAFHPPGVAHLVRVPPSAEREMVVVTAISPPEFDLYAASGVYNMEYGVINQEAAFFAHQNAVPGELSPEQEMHAHPAADECVVLWAGQARAYACGRWHDKDTYGCVFTPCGVRHGISAVPSTTLWGGFAAPPQLDLYRRTDWLNDGVFTTPPFERLDVPAELLPS